jgi:hypothetical protein
MDTEAPWRKSGYHGWWYGWKVPLAVGVGSIWLPVAAECPIASAADHLMAPKLLEPWPLEVRYVLGDTHDHTPALRAECALHNRELVATRRGPYPHRDGGVEVRRLFHTWRSRAMEPFNGWCKNIFAWRGQRPVKGLKRCQLLVLGAILLYQIVLLYQHQRQQPVGLGVQSLTASGLIYDHVSIKQRGAPALGALLATGATTEESDAVLAVNFAYGEMNLAREIISVACGIDLR